ncbi:MAG: pyridoxamine kinase [Butyrivibrio sp.]|nr:pyridoxamine kinase [Butyrivibrio sp.]
MKKVATCQDLSCVGKCSLSVALPILSCVGIETSVLPTAVLSANSAFPGFTFRELTKDIPGILRHWKEIGLSFDALYVGYLGNARQAEPVRQMFQTFGGTKPDGSQTIRIIDPAMADNGKLYRGVSSDMIGAMRRLVSLADVITPNLTEACLLTGTMYREDMNRDEVVELLRKLSQLGGISEDDGRERRSVILTGMSLHEGEVGAISYDAGRDSIASYYRERIPGHYHGTGDIFTSVVTGALTRGIQLEEATAIAVDFTLDAIRHTQSIPEEERLGVSFEEALPGLIEKMKAYC